MKKNIKHYYLKANKCLKTIKGYSHDLAHG